MRNVGKISSKVIRSDVEYIIPKNFEPIYFITPYGVGESDPCFWMDHIFGVNLDLYIFEKTPIWAIRDSIEIEGEILSYFFYDDFGITWFKDFGLAIKKFFEEYGKTYPVENFEIYKKATTSFLHPVIKRSGSLLKETAWGQPVDDLFLIEDLSKMYGQEVDTNYFSRISSFTRGRIKGAETLAKAIKSHYPHTTSIQNTVDKELSRFKGIWEKIR